MDHRKKLLELLGVNSFKDYVEPRTFEGIMQTGQYYMDMFAKAFAQGDVHRERVRAEIDRLLAEMLQREARKRYGVADEAPVRQLVSETFETAAAEEWDRLMNILREGVGRSSLDAEQQAAFLEQMEGLRGPFLDMICSETARLKLIPLENVNELSLAVAEMFREDVHAYQGSDNRQLQEAASEGQ